MNQTSTGLRQPDDPSTTDPVVRLIDQVFAALIPPRKPGTIEINVSSPELLRRHLALELLPNAYTGAYHWAHETFRMMSALDNAAYVDDPEADIVTQVLPPEISRPIQRGIEAYLEVARRVQNGVQPFLSRLCKSQPPYSLADIVKDIRKDRSALPSDVKKTIIEYWEEAGWLLRWYRDRSQHFAVVPSEVVLWKPRGETRWRVSCLLPDTPSAEDDSRIAYLAGENHAEIFIGNSFLALTSFVVECLRHVEEKLELTLPTSSRQYAIKNPAFLGTSATGHEVLSIEALTTSLVSLHAELGLIKPLRG